jgi:hypothetical protein
MAFTDGQHRQFKKWVQEHFSKRGCLACGSRSWGIVSFLNMPIRPTAVTPVDFIGYAAGLNANVIPCIALHCSKCGTIQFVSAITAGVVDGSLQPLPGLPPPVEEGMIDLDKMDGPPAPPATAPDLKVVPPAPKDPDTKPE